MLAANLHLADSAAIAAAVRLLQSGDAVALPTETVYGLAADACNADAVAAIYRIKGRPDFNPLIVHVADLAAAERIALFDDRARALAAAFWPGALTMVLPLREGGRIAQAVTAGLASIALRCPAHGVMQAVLAQSGLVLAAPSANASGAISPSSAAHVAASLGARVAMILDGGATALGLESTIVALRYLSDRGDLKDGEGDGESGGWQILRPGPITQDQISAILGDCPAAMTASAEPHAIEAPGQLASHYAPTKPLRLNAATALPSEFHIGFGDVAGDWSLSPGADLAEAAARLYAGLHLADAHDQPAIAIAPIPADGMGAAINDRLSRAAAPRPARDQSAPQPD